jgi:hypothetical protein
MLRFVSHCETTLFGLCILLEIPGLLTNCTGSNELGPFTNVPVPLRVDALSGGFASCGTETRVQICAVVT